jgi:glutathione S-transferase
VLVRLSGQRQVPVVVDPNQGDRAIHDSTAIALYLDERYPDPPLLPADPDARAECLMLEDWIDHAIGQVARKVFIWDKMRVDQDFVRKTMDWNADAMTKRLLPLLGPILMKQMMKRDGIDERTVAEARTAAHRTLDILERRLVRAPYLTGARRPRFRTSPRRGRDAAPAPRTGTHARPSCARRPSRAAGGAPALLRLEGRDVRKFRKKAP